MGFRTGAYAKIWEVTPMSGTATKLRLSTSHKSKQTNEYEQDFSGYVICAGTAAANKAAGLQAGDRIKIGDCDVTTKYDADRHVTYTNYKIFSFDEVKSRDNDESSEPASNVDDGDIDDSTLPF